MNALFPYFCLLIALAILICLFFKITDYAHDKACIRKRARLEAFAPDITRKEKIKKELTDKCFDQIREQNWIKEEIQQIEENLKFLPESRKEEYYLKKETLKEDYWNAMTAYEMFHKELLKINSEIETIYKEFEKRKG